MGEIERLLTTSDVADIFAVTSKTVRCWLADGKLSAVRVGRELRFRRTDIQRLVTARKPCSARLESEESAPPNAA